ncbi:MAG: VCBS repeat-containing protein [Cyclobacteriaceae bacterium]
MKNPTLLLLVSVYIIASCSENTLFRNLPPSQTGIQFNNEIEPHLSDTFNVLDFEYMYNGAGVAAGDVNNDGLIDLYFAGNFVSGKLYLNEGQLKFKDITDQSKTSTDRWGTGVSMVDINQDGWLDIYVCVAGPEELGKSRENYFFINQGLDENGIPVFEDQAKSYGLADSGYSTMAAFFDYDKDNDLDVYLLTNALETYNRNNLRQKITDGSAASNDRLYRNNGDGSFSNVNEEAGILIEGWGLGVCISDINQDGWPDIYVANDFVSNDLIWINQGDGTFKDMANEYLKLQTHNGMGVDVADYNNDMLPDIVVLDMLPEGNYREKMMIASGNYDKQQMRREFGFGDQYMRNTLQLNQGRFPDGRLKFSEIGYLAGIFRTDWSWAPLFADFDNDGHKDLFIANGYRKDITNMDYIVYSQQSAQNMFGTEEAKKARRKENLKGALDKLEEVKLSNFIFKNNQDLTFSDFTKEWGLDIPGFSNGAIYADLDNDGDLDIVTNNIDDPAYLLENRLLQSEGDSSHFVRVKLKSDQLTLGSKVILSTGGSRQYLEYNPYRGYKSTVEPTLHFGTGTNTVIDSIQVIWPDNKVSLLTHVEADQTFTINSHAAQITRERIQVGEVGEITTSNYLLLNKDGNTNLSSLVHHEDGYDDFKDTPMLPHQLSQMGPYAAVGDLNGDGVDDIVMGSDYGKPTIIGFQINGNFEFSVLPGDSVFEDRSIVIFDSEQDGDNDIYIVSGGSRWSKNHKNYQDRLYLNDGHGNFELSDGLLPDMTESGSTAQPVDLDQDGDIDLFVGGYLIPRRYPLSPKSTILINERGVFKDQTNDFAPELLSLGMVRDASWGDLNNDQKPDLVIVGEWMPIAVFMNDGSGKLIESTSDYQLDQATGWYHSVELADLDGNGFQDILVGNHGRNTYYQATVDEPIEIFAKDFDNTGSMDPIMTHYNQGERFISFYRDQLISQINGAKGRFQRFDEFAKATFEESFTEEEIEGSHHEKVTELASFILENTGSKLIRHDLPVSAQFSSISDFEVYDFNRDGISDLMLVGNTNSGDPIRGDLNASYGSILVGKSGFQFEALKPSTSGFFVEGFCQDIIKILLSGKPHFIITRTNDYPLIFSGEKTERKNL